MFNKDFMYAAHLMISTPYIMIQICGPNNHGFQMLENLKKNVSMTSSPLRVPGVIFHFWHGVSVFRTSWFTKYYSPNAQNLHKDVTTLVKMRFRDQGFEFICLVLKKYRLDLCLDIEIININYFEKVIYIPTQSPARLFEHQLVNQKKG